MTFGDERVESDTSTSATGMVQTRTSYDNGHSPRR